MLHARLRAERTDKKYSWSASCKIKYFITYLQVANVLLKKYETNEIIAETETSITRFAQLSNMMSFHNAEKLVIKTLRCGNVNEENALNEITVENLDVTILYSIRENWGNENMQTCITSGFTKNPYSGSKDTM